MKIEIKMCPDVLFQNVYQLQYHVMKEFSKTFETSEILESLKELEI